MLTVRAAVAGALVVALSGHVGCGTGGTQPAAAVLPSAPPGAVSVAFSEFNLAVAPATAAPGHVTFHLANSGRTKHDFVILGPTGLRAAQLPSDDAYETIDEWEVGLVGDRRGIEPGTAVSFEIELQAGHHALICNLPDHYNAGMRADFDVQ